MSESGEIDLDHHLGAIVLGDTHAFGLFLAASEPALRRSLRGFAAQLDTEAVLQETMLRLWQVAPRIEPDGRPNCALRLGLRIARNLAIDETRRTRRTVLQADPESEAVLRSSSESPSPPDPLLREHLAHCMDKLPERPRKALMMRLLETGSKPEDEIASAVQMTKNTFFQNVARARKWLLSCLKERGVDELEGALLSPATGESVSVSEESI